MGNLVGEADVEVATVGPGLATTGGVTAINTIGSTGLAAVVTVGQSVAARITAGVSVDAGEDASAHIRGAASGGVDGHAVATHVDLTGNIDGGIVTGGELTPGVVDLTILAEGGNMVVESRPSTGDTVGERDGDLVTVVDKGVRDHGGTGVHEAGGVVSGGVVPDNNGERDTGVVGVGESVRTVGAKPDVAVITLSVSSLASHTNVGHPVAVIDTQTENRAATIKGLGEVVAGHVVSGLRNDTIKSNRLVSWIMIPVVLVEICLPVGVDGRDSGNSGDEPSHGGDGRLGEKHVDVLGEYFSSKDRLIALRSVDYWSSKGKTV